MNITQNNKIINYYGNILDLVFCEEKLNVCEAPIPLVPPDKHHPPLIVNLSSMLNGSDSKHETFHKPFKPTRFNLKMGDYFALYQSILPFDKIYNIYVDTIDEIASKIN